MNSKKTQEQAQVDIPLMQILEKIKIKDSKRLHKNIRKIETKNDFKKNTIRELKLMALLKVSNYKESYQTVQLVSSFYSLESSKPPLAITRNIEQDPSLSKQQNH